VRSVKRTIQTMDTESISGSGEDLEYLAIGAEISVIRKLAQHAVLASIARGGAYGTPWVPLGTPKRKAQSQRYKEDSRVD